MSFNKVITEENGKFHGYLTLHGKKVIGSDRESQSKIGIGSILGSLAKTMSPNNVETSEEVDANHIPEKKVSNVSAPNRKMKPKEEQREDYIKRLHGQAIETIQINGVQVHIIDHHWASSLKLEHKEVSYSIEIISPSEIFMSRTVDIALGACYFDVHAPKFVDWMQNGLDLQDTGNTIHEREKLWKSHMILWNFHNYKVLAIKKV